LKGQVRRLSRLDDVRRRIQSGAEPVTARTADGFFRRLAGVVAGPSGVTPERRAYSPGDRLGGIVIVMETTSVPAPAAPDAGAPSSGASPAEELPGLYRAILDRVAILENGGARDEAATIRRLATEAYSGAWDAAGRRTLASLVSRADRAIAGDAPQRAWLLRRRSAPAR
jgi:hypothetical protein